MDRARSLLPAVDRAAFAVALATRLRPRGVPVGLTQVQDLVRALSVSPPVTRTTLYWSARICLVRDHDDLAEFDAVFDAVFGDAVLPVDPHARRDGLGGARGKDDRYASMPEARPEGSREGAGLPWVTLPPAVAGAEHSDDHALTVPERLPSELADLVDTPFEQLSPQETALLGQWLEAALPTWPTRRSRRFTIQPRGTRVAVRATMARSRCTGWEPVRLVRAGPVTRPRRVVVLCDVSQSMRAQTVAYLHLMRAITLTSDAEVFAFATTLTRLTRVIGHRSAEAAIDAASARVVDRFGGTRIADCLRSLLDSHHGGLLRGAVVIIGSDGWDAGPPECLAAAMARLRRRAYRVIWLNPRASAPGFVPRTTTMAAALPYCDALLPADTFGSLLRVPAEIARCGAGARAGARPGARNPDGSGGGR
ncbi:VWA domain-containing protein [Actinacidiphila oryziradicis]|uniref:VWA domain-containing protein n=1 Tax=Actinacidiphila oryziradicis TaxID=2571141 RepID=A0A4U0SHE6_9ACTN|nr:VWA domain-containing protein [Actinacidiphila oryziradicis]